MRYCPKCRLQAEATLRFCPKCRRVLLRIVPQRQRFSRPSAAAPPRQSRKPRSSTRTKKPGDVFAAAFERLGPKENKGQILVVLVLGLLMMLAAVLSTMRGGGEGYEAEMRTKSLVYSIDSGKMALYWMDDEANLHKATPEEIRRCEELHPDEVPPICQTTYYEKHEDEQ